MIRIKIGESDPRLDKLLAHFKKVGMQEASLPATAAALKAGASLGRGVWQGFALGGKLKGVEPLKGANKGYARSIKSRKTGPFTHAVYSESEIAARIENGTPELDMKKTHTRGPRSRVSADGHAYLIVPFQWGTPGKKGDQRVGFGKNVIDAGSYKAVKKFEKMRTAVSADRAPLRARNAQGKNVGRALYNKGYGRLKEKDIGGEVDKEMRSRMSGMVRSTDATGKNRSGGYFTFRVISARPGATGWIRPAVPPRSVARAVEKETEAAISAMAEPAIIADLGA